MILFKHPGFAKLLQIATSSFWGICQQQNLKCILIPCPSETCAALNVIYFTSFKSKYHPQRIGLKTFPSSLLLLICRKTFFFGLISICKLLGMVIDMTKFPVVNHPLWFHYAKWKEWFQELVRSQQHDPIHVFSWNRSYISRAWQTSYLVCWFFFYLAHVYITSGDLNHSKLKVWIFHMSVLLYTHNLTSVISFILSNSPRLQKFNLLTILSDKWSLIQNG